MRGNRLYCPLCNGEFKKFLTAGMNKRPNAMCPSCGSLERHRLLWVMLEDLWQNKQINKGGKMLHIAPEEALAFKFKQDFDYISTALDREAMVKMDLTTIGFPDETFDAIVCNHVLEHIPDDIKALSELFRILKPEGWGSINVPIIGEVTQEDIFITDPKERERLYGQKDHIRQYGKDFKYRLAKAGFEVLEIEKSELMKSAELDRISIASENIIFIVRK